MENIIAMVVLLILVGTASAYIYQAKKKGKRCIGCPYAGCASCQCKNNE